MIFLLLLAALAIWAAVATLVEVRRDGYGPCATDWTRVSGRDEDAAAGPRILP
ncbi:hypothetical protein ACWGJP_06895 [Microbacterium sp. NPDC055903]